MKVGDLVKWTSVANKYGMVVDDGPHYYFNDSFHIVWFDGEGSGWFHITTRCLEVINEHR